MAEEQESNFEAPGGFKASFRGAQTQIVALMFLLLAFIVYVGKSYAEENKMRQEAIIQMEKDNLRAIHGVIWMLSLPQEKREQLNLNRPEVIKEMQH